MSLGESPLGALDALAGLWCDSKQHRPGGVVMCDYSIKSEAEPLPPPPYHPHSHRRIGEGRETITAIGVRVEVGGGL
ncbi:hypothetical protein EYF80_011722 [Liparis tanakae]|uniref:Uncharacterized protein n=1 Tax=Liparis tanakae TaxID=230148 RepID=A0A4Z2IIX8_9TELE|nr:hypothetical protein EYF80_011722 [Liparis tanakae]